MGHHRHMETFRQYPMSGPRRATYVCTSEAVGRPSREVLATTFGRSATCALHHPILTESRASSTEQSAYLLGLLATPLCIWIEGELSMKCNQSPNQQDQYMRHCCELIPFGKAASFPRSAPEAGGSATPAELTEGWQRC